MAQRAVAALYRATASPLSAAGPPHGGLAVELRNGRRPSIGTGRRQRVAVQRRRGDVDGPRRHPKNVRAARKPNLPLSTELSRARRRRDLRSSRRTRFGSRKNRKGRKAVRLPHCTVCVRWQGSCAWRLHLCSRRMAPAQKPKCRDLGRGALRRVSRPRRR